MTNLEKSLSEGTLNVFDVGQEVKTEKRPTHILTDVETGETREIYEGYRLYTDKQIHAGLRRKEATDAQMAYGPFTFLFFTPLTELGFDISLASYTRLMYTSTYMTYKGFIGDTPVGGNPQPFSRNKLRTILKLSEERFDTFWDEMISSGIFKPGTTENDHGKTVKAIYLDETKFHRGGVDTIPTQSFIRLNIEGVRSLYETCKSARMHNTLAYIFKIIPWVNREWNLACTNPDEKVYDNIKYLRLGDFAEMVGYSRDNAKRLAKDLNSVRFTWRNREQAAFVYMTNAPDRPDEWIIAINPRIYYAGQNYENVQIPNCDRD